MFLSQLITIATVHLLAVMSPGPDLSIVIKNTNSGGKKSGVYTAIGIATGILIHSTYALLGISILIKNTPWLFSAIKYIGVIYLIYLAYQSFKSTNNFRLSKSKDVRHEVFSIKESYTNGLLTNLLNPNASIFLLTVFTQVIGVDTPHLYKLIYALEMIVATALWFIFISYTLDNKFTKILFEKHKSTIDKIMGIVLVLLAIKVIIG